MKKFQWIFLAATLLGFPGLAEMRVWTGEDGELFEGEFQRELLGRVQVLDAKGEKRLMSLEKLSIADLNYLKKNVVPDVEITCRKSSTIRPPLEWTIRGDQTLLYTCDVTLEKKSDMDSSSKLTAELYVIAEEVDGDNWVLVHREAKKFVFPEGRHSSYSFTVDGIECRRYDARWAKQSRKWRGWTYLGYVVVMLDQKGQIAAHKTDLATEDWMELGIPVVVERLRKLAVDGRGSVYSRHFGKDVEKSKLPRIEWHARTAFF